MALNGPIILIKNEAQEQKKIRDVLIQIGSKNPMEMFGSAEEALAYLGMTDAKPFIILSKMTLPTMSGLKFLDKIYESDFLRQKGIPFIFFANVDNPDVVQQAYDKRVQGYFLKPKSPAALKLTLLSIVDYWQRSTHPNSD